MAALARTIGVLADITPLVLRRHVRLGDLRLGGLRCGMAWVSWGGRIVFSANWSSRGRSQRRADRSLAGWRRRGVMLLAWRVELLWGSVVLRWGYVELRRNGVELRRSGGELSRSGGELSRSGGELSRGSQSLGGRNFGVMRGDVYSRDGRLIEFVLLQFTRALVGATSLSKLSQRFMRQSQAVPSGVVFRVFAGRVIPLLHRFAPITLLGSCVAGADCGCAGAPDRVGKCDLYLHLVGRQRAGDHRCGLLCQSAEDVGPGRWSRCASRQLALVGRRTHCVLLNNEPCPRVDESVLNGGQYLGIAQPHGD